LACYIPRWYTRPKTVTHPGTNRARRALTSFMRRTPLTTTPKLWFLWLAVCLVKKNFRQVGVTIAYPAVPVLPKYLWNQLIYGVQYFCICVNTAGRGLNVESIGQDQYQMQKCMYYASISKVQQYWLTDVLAGFHCDVTSCQVARRGVRRGAAYH